MMNERRLQDFRPWARPILRRDWTRRPFIALLAPAMFISAFVIGGIRSVAELVSELKEMW